jgi:hypothetical protein
MRARNIRCTVVEVPENTDMVRNDLTSLPRDLLPWADPYVAKLLAKHRLQSALNDSLDYLKGAVHGPTPLANRFCGDEQPAGGGSPWDD